MRVPVQARTLDELRNITTPTPVSGGNMETYRHVLFDTQTYPAAGPTGGQLVFFANTNADASLCNLEVGGSLPDPDYAQLFYGRIVPVLGYSSATIPLNIADMLDLMLIGRPIVTVTIMSKPYGPEPGSLFHGGGIEPFGYSDGAGAGVVSHDFATSGPNDGGFCFDGALWLLPKASFRVTLRWGNPQAIAADTLIRFELDTCYYRSIR